MFNFFKNDYGQNHLLWNLISLTEFNLPLSPYRFLYMTHAAQALPSHDLSGERIKLWITCIFFYYIRTWRASPVEWSAECWGHFRDSTNMKDDTHQAHTHSFQQGEYEMMIMVAKWYLGNLWAKVSWHLSYRWGKPPKKSHRKPVPAGDETRALCVTRVHATSCSTAVGIDCEIDT